MFIRELMVIYTVFQNTEDEKHEMVQCCAKGMKTTNIVWKLNGDYQIIIRFVSDLEHSRTRSDKGLLMKVPVKKINCIKRAAIKKASVEQQTGIWSCWRLWSLKSLSMQAGSCA